MVFWERSSFVQKARFVGMYEYFVQFVSIMTVTLSIGIKLIGEPDQIRKIIKSKNVANISMINYILGVLAYIFWTIHGIIKGDWVIIIAQFAGVLSSGAVLILLIYYRKPKEK